MSQDGVYGVTMSHERVGDLLVVVHCAEPPAKDEWSRFCRAAASLRNARGELRVLAAAGRITAGPNAGQRSELNSLVPREHFYAAVLCDTFAARAAVNALALFNPNMRAFDTHRIEDAVAYLQRSLTPELSQAIERMHRQLRDAGHEAGSDGTRARR